MERVRLRVSCYPKVSHDGYTAQLHIKNLDAPLPPARTACLGQLLTRLIYPNGRPVTLGECSAYLPGARVGDCVLQVSDFEQGFSYVIYFPRDDGIEAYRLAVRGRGGEPREVIRSRGGVLVPDLVYVKRPYQMESWFEVPLVLAEANKDACLKWLHDNAGDECFPDVLENLKDPIEHWFPRLVMADTQPLLDEIADPRAKQASARGER